MSNEKETAYDKRERMDKRREKMGKAIVVCIVLMIVIPISALTITYGFNKPNYDREVHSYIENAWSASTPQAIYDNLTLAEQGMHDLNLQNNDNANAIFKYNSTTMEYQYHRIENIKALCVAAMNQTGTDLQTSLMNIRADIYTVTADGNDHWCDKLAEDAYSVKYYAYSTWIWAFIELSLLLAIAMMTIYGIYIGNKYHV